MNERQPHVLIMSGGTGGHVFPALAVAEELQQRNYRVTWLGTREGLEATLVPRAGFQLHVLPVSGLRGKGILELLWVPWRLGFSLWSALFLLQKIKPDAVIGFGGYASGPGGLIAAALGTPLLIHEQNAVAGMTNRWLARVADQVFSAFPKAFSVDRQVSVIGNPVRSSIVNISDPDERFSCRMGPLRILVLGGSLGALRLNEVIPAALAKWNPEDRPLVRHQAGERTLSLAIQAYAKAGVDAEVTPFIEDMAEAYEWADLVIARAGALTVSEISASGSAALLVPYPFAVDDHQRMNANYLLQSKAAWVVNQEVLDPQWLGDFLSNLDRDQLMSVASAARSMARVDAVHLLTEACIESIRSVKGDS